MAEHFMPPAFESPNFMHRDGANGRLPSCFWADSRMGIGR